MTDISFPHDMGREEAGRWHQAVAMDCPEPRPIQVPEQGAVVEVTEAGGLYRHYERLAA